MKIAHVCAVFPPYHSGTGTVCHYNALYLAQRGHDVTVITSNHPEGQFTYAPEMKVERLPITFRIGNAPLLLDLVKLRGFDIIHIHLPFIFGSELIWLASQFSNTPLVATYHNDLIGVGLRKHIFNVYTHSAYQLILNRVQRICSVSIDHANGSYLQHLSAKRKQRLVEIPNGVDVEKFSPSVDGTAIRLRYGIGSHARVLTFVGALDQAHHFKGVEYLLRTFAEFCLVDEHNHLMIIGGGDLKTHYEQLAKDLDLKTRVTFTGDLTHEDLPAYYRASDVVILPSFPPESFGIVLIEAMACGRPVIAHDIPGVRTVIEDGSDGFLVSPNQPKALAEKILLLLGDKERSDAMGMNGRKKVENRYTWPKIAEHLEHVYEDVIAHAAR